MAALDIPSIQTEIKSQQVIVEKKIGGAMNMGSWRDLDTEGKAHVATLTGEYEKWREVLERLNLAVRDLMALGYPTLPTVKVLPSMLVILDREMAEEAFARLSFVAEGTAAATKANVTFSEPQKK